MSVLHVADLVLGGAAAEKVDDQLGISLAEVHDVMAHYYHPDKMTELRAVCEEPEAELRDQSDVPRQTA